MSPRQVYAVKLLVSAGILAACFYYTDFTGFAEAFSSVAPSYSVAVLVVTLVGSILIPAMVTKVALQSAGLPLSYRELVKINLAVRFYTLIFPRGMATGVRWMKYREKGTGQDALALLIFEKITQILMLTLTATIFLWLDAQKLGEAGRVLLLVGAGGLVASSFCFVTFFSRGFRPIYRRLSGLVERAAPKGLADKLRSLSDAMENFQKLRLHQVAAVFGLSLASYILFILGPYILSFGMELDLSLRAIAWVRSITLLLALIPVTIAGLGVREISFVAFLGLYGIANHQALAFSIFLFAVHIVIGAVGAVLELWGHVLRPLFEEGN